MGNPHFDCSRFAFTHKAVFLSSIFSEQILMAKAHSLVDIRKRIGLMNCYAKIRFDRDYFFVGEKIPITVEINNKEID